MGGVQHMTMPKHFIVEVRSGGAAGTSYICDMLTAFNALAFSDVTLADVRVAGHEALCMRDLNNIAVSVFPARARDRAVCGSENRCAMHRREVEAFMAG